MNSEPAPLVFDYGRIRAKASRAQDMARPGADFLVHHAATEIGERLSVTNRVFTRALDLFSPSNALEEAVRHTLPGIAVDRLTDLGGRRNDDLRLGEGAYDLVVSAFGLHRCNDLPGTLIQIRRALKPDGLFMAAMPGEGTLWQLRNALIAAETAACGGAAVRVEPFADVRQCGLLLQRAGFALPVADLDELTLRYRDLHAFLADLRAIGAASALAGPVRALPKAVAALLEAQYRRSHEGPDRKLPVSVNIVYLTGWSAHESQQKPLKPGTATARLSDFLKP